LKPHGLNAAPESEKTKWRPSSLTRMNSGPGFAVEASDCPNANAVIVKETLTRICSHEEMPFMIEDGTHVRALSRGNGLKVHACGRRAE